MTAQEIISQLNPSGKTLRQGNLIAFGKKVLEKAEDPSLPSPIQQELKEQGNKMIKRGASQWANNVGNIEKKKIEEKNPKEKGDHRTICNKVVTSLREYLNNPKNAEILQVVKDAIKNETIPYYERCDSHPSKQGSGVRGGGRPGGGKGGRGRGKSSKTREFEFLFEAPFTFESSLYASSLNPTAEFEQSWLFEAPFLSEATLYHAYEDEFEGRATSVPQVKGISTTQVKQNIRNQLQGGRKPGQNNAQQRPRGR